MERPIMAKIVDGTSLVLGELKSIFSFWVCGVCDMHSVIASSFYIHLFNILNNSTSTTIPIS